MTKKHSVSFFSALLSGFFFLSCANTKALAVTTKEMSTWNSSEAYTSGPKSSITEKYMRVNGGHKELNQMLSLKMIGKYLGNLM